MTTDLINNYAAPELARDVELLLAPAPPESVTRRNRVLRFGRGVAYRSGTHSSVIPSVLVRHDVIGADQVTVNEYLPGQRIDWHVDKPEAGNVIAIISLLSTATLEFRKGGQSVGVVLPDRSLYLLRGELRWEWEHSLTAVQRRISIVYRRSPASPKQG